MRISAYETGDGRIHKDRAIARKHQAWLDLVAWCDFNLSEECSGPRDAAGMLEHRDALIKLLRNAEEAP